jgi:hypothetical protein
MSIESIKAGGTNESAGLAVRFGRADPGWPSKSTPKPGGSSRLQSEADAT